MKRMDCRAANLCLRAAGVTGSRQAECTARPSSSSYVASAFHGHSRFALSRSTSNVTYFISNAAAPWHSAMFHRACG